VFLNLCDGAWDESRPGIEVVDALERLELAFTGAGTAFYEPSREAMKRVCHYLDIPCPRGVAVRGGDEAASVMARLRFPLIGKHPNSYSSIGLTPASRVQTLAELEEQIDRMTDRFGGALVEEFVEGREFTVLVAAQAEHPMPKAYPRWSACFPPGRL
jgi:D-alanine-D-alanine ligase-like ATP-grasp enzyme